MTQELKNRTGEKGNVLFLILIAVALFAALSYAVTQSTRSGSGSTEKEKAILSGASMTQHPTAIRTGLIRMVLGGVDIADLKFNPPSAFGALETTELVFHPNGGGAVSQFAPADLMTGTSQGTWFFNAHFEIPNIGTNGSGGNDIIAFLPGITQSVCRRINDEFSISVTGCTSNDGLVPDIDSGVTEANITQLMDDSYTLPTGNQEDIGNAACAAFAGQASGCFFDAANSRYVFYSVLLER